MDIVPSISSPSTINTHKKMRKKTDIKPQSQINKCNNEKRRRELENNYIEHLGEMLQLNKRGGDMTSTKPDKAAILNQVVKEYRELCDKGQNSENNSNLNVKQATTVCAKCSMENCKLHPVQQDDVSSTGHKNDSIELVENASTSSITPEISANFEALEHYISSQSWVLMQINKEGVILSCTQNIREFIGFEKSEIIQNKIYTYLHSIDKTKIHNMLNNKMVENKNSWDHDDKLKSLNKIKRSCSMKVRMNVKKSMIDIKSEDDRFVDLIIIAAPAKDEIEDPLTSFICLITKADMEYASERENIVNLFSLSSSSSSKSSALSHTKGNVQQNFAAPNQVAMKFDKDGKILQTNLNPDCVGKNIIDLCHTEDKDKMKMHIHSVLNPKQSNLMLTSSHVPPNYSCLESFRIIFSPQSPFVRVKADSRFFFNQTPGECDYIMCILTIIDGPLVNDNSVENSNSTSSPIDSFMPSSIESNLYAKQNSNYLSSNSSNVGGPLMTSVLNASSPRATQTFTNTLENSSSVFNEYDIDFDIDQVNFEPSRPNSRASSSSNMFHSANIPSNIDQDSNNVCGFNFNVFPNNYGVGGGDFSDSRDQLNNNSKFSNKNLTDNHTSEKLRNLLTTKKSSTEEQEQQNRILKGLLNSDEEKEPFAVVAPTKLNQSQQGRSVPISNTNQKSNDSKNTMLLSLLNEKNEDDENSTKSKQSELLRQLKKEEGVKDVTHHSTNYSPDELRNLLKIQESDRSITRKRPPNDGDDSSCKKGEEKNRKYSLKENPMLAKLLSEKPKNPPILPPKQVNIKVIPDITPSNSRSNEHSHHKFKMQQSEISHVTETQKLQLIQQQQQQQQLSMQNALNARNFQLMDDNLQYCPITSSMMSSNQITLSERHHKTNTENDPELAKIINEFIDFQDIDVSRTQIPSGCTEKNEKIIEIEKSLMMCESTNYNSSCNLDNSAFTLMNQQNTSKVHPPLLDFQQALPQSTAGNNSILGNVMSMQMHNLQQQQQRLLQQQQKQQVVVHDASARNERICMNPDISNIGSLLNNSVAPNVTLKRSTGASDSSLSPEYINNLVHHQRSPSFQAYQNNFSPNQMPFNHKSGINTSPMSPRQTGYNQPGQGNTNQNWQNSVRLSLQHNNPMLSAQLQNFNSPGRFFPVRNARSPSNIPRQANFLDNESFSNTSSPSHSPFANNIYSQQRIPRQNNLPQTTQHFSGNTNDFVRQELRAVVNNRNQGNNMCSSGSLPSNVLSTNASSVGTKRSQSNLGNLIVSTCQSSNMSSPQPANTNSQLSPNQNMGFNFDIGQNDFFSGSTAR
ncbi:NCOA2 family protein [Megaselia abdita]